MTTKTASLVGAGIGAATFLAIGLLPALLYGGYAGLLLGAGIFGAPAHIGARILTVFGMVLGTLAVGSLFIVAGAALGAAVYSVSVLGSKMSRSRFTRRA